jgi:DNA-binding protein HU-beta
MNRNDLIAKIAAEHEMSKAQAGRVLTTVFDTIMTSVKKGERVSLPGFGSFSRVARAARKGFNPATREPIKIAAVKLPRFAPGATFKTLVDPKAAARKQAKKAT